MYVICLIVTNKLGCFTVYPTCDNILNQHDLGRALVRNSFALTVC